MSSSTSAPQQSVHQQSARSRATPPGPPPGPPRADRTLHCARCGVEFLWPREEQAPSVERPARCAGCRRLLPGATRERGLVRWFNARRRYGFITRGDGDEIFVHGSQVQRAEAGPAAGRRRLLEGDLVEFAVVESERGPQAEAVAILQVAQGVENEG